MTDLRTLRRAFRAGHLYRTAAGVVCHDGTRLHSTRLDHLPAPAASYVLTNAEEVGPAEASGWARRICGLPAGAPIPKPWD